MKQISFLRAVSTVSGGMAAGQAITLCSLPIVTRLYSPEEFGVFQSLEAIIQIVMIAGAMSFDRAFVAADNERTRANIFFVALPLSIISSLIGFAVCVFLILDTPQDIVQMNWIFSISMLTVFLGRSAFRILSQYTLSIGEYSIVARAEFNRATVNSLSRIVFGMLGMGVIGLVLSAVQGTLFGFASQIRCARDNLLSTLKDLTVRDLAATLKRFRKFPLIEGPAALMAVMAERLPIVLIGMLYSLEAAGAFAIALTLTSRPIGIVTQAASSVLRTRIGQARFSKHDGDGEPLGKRLGFLWLTIAVVVLPLALVSPYLMPLLLGQNWAEVGPCITAMSLRIFSIMSLRPLFGALSALEHLPPVLWGQFLIFLSSLLPLLVSSYVFDTDFLAAVWAMSAATFVVFLFIVTLKRRLLLGGSPK